METVLRGLREFNRLKQIDVSKWAWISKSVVYELESWKRPCSSKIIQKYSDFFKVKVSDIYWIDECLEAGDILPHPSLSKKVNQILEWRNSSWM